MRQVISEERKVGTIGRNGIKTHYIKVSRWDDGSTTAYSCGSIDSDYYIGYLEDGTEVTCNRCKHK